jgi:hypothetical protein
VVVEESFGTDGEQARTAAARVRARIEECELGGTGAMQVRVSQDPSRDGLRVTIGRGPPLPSAERWSGDRLAACLPLSSACIAWRSSR